MSGSISRRQPVENPLATCPRGSQVRIDNPPVVEIGSKWLGGAGEKANFSRRVRVRFVVGLPHQKAGVPMFCVWPVLFRVPSPALSESEPRARNVAREQRDVVERVLGWARELEENPSLRRADIARREGLSRARVSQLMRLARLPAGRLKGLRASKGENFSVRDFLKIAGAGENNPTVYEEEGVEFAHKGGGAAREVEPANVILVRKGRCFYWSTNPTGMI